MVPQPPRYPPPRSKWPPQPPQLPVSKARPTCRPLLKRPTTPPKRPSKWPKGGGKGDTGLGKGGKGSDKGNDKGVGGSGGKGIGKGFDKGSDKGVGGQADSDEPHWRRVVRIMSNSRGAGDDPTLLFKGQQLRRHGVGGWGMTQGTPAR